MKISIVGTGYVGLVSGACLADRGHQVTCIDIDPRKVDMINSGVPPIHENGLPELMARVVGKSLHATTDLKAAVLDSEVTLIAVGTPAHEGKIDLRYIEQACADVGNALRDKPGYHVLAIKSTVIPGTTDGAARLAAEKASGKKAGTDFGLGMNPEFLTEGTAVEDFMNPDRIVVGGIDARSQDVLAKLYESFPDAPMIKTNNSTAEMIKYASNSVLATLISFSNELSRLCAELGTVDIADVTKGVHAATYFTTRLPDGQRVRASIASFVEAGCGFGGSCLPKDVTALVAQGLSLGLPMPMLASVLEINREQPAQLIKLIRKHHPDLKGLKVAVLGLAFKPDTDDVRESPAFPIIAALRDGGATVVAHDPIARPGGDAMRDVRIIDALKDAVSDADVVVLVTRWAEYQGLDALLASLGRQPLVVDGRRVLEPSRFAHYEGIGR